MAEKGLIVMEGNAVFNVSKAGKPCSTYYRVIGRFGSGKTPLVVLHGGPGACHEYLLPLVDLSEHLSIPIIFYDQIGNGRSTHLPEKMGDEKFWTEQLFIDELDNLIDVLKMRDDGFDLLGQGWGGMFGSTYASTNPRGLRRLILASVPASQTLWIESQLMLRSGMSRVIQEVLNRCERDKRTDTAEYKAAFLAYSKRHTCQVKPWPASDLAPALQWLDEDPTVYATMMPVGPSEIIVKNRSVGSSRGRVTGSLRHWTVVDKIHKIKAMTLLINGVDDEVQDLCMEPFFRLIPKVKWITIQYASHFAHIEQREYFMKLVGDFLSM